MKRVVDGVAYNTDTSTEIAEKHYDHEAYGNDPGKSGTITLYQTRGGAFFIVDDGHKEVWNSREREHEQRPYVEFSSIDADRAREMLTRGDWTISDDSFAEFPEAEAEPKGEKPSTLYVRMPASLKRRVDEAADEEKVSANVLAMRCLERCLARSASRRSWEDILASSLASMINPLYVAAKGQTTDDIRGQIADDIEGTSYWRSQNAVDYPDDKRNTEAVSSLERLSKEVRELDAAHSLFKALSLVWSLADDRTLERMVERQSEFFRSIGFHSDYANASDLLAALLDDLTNELKQQIAEN